jgi:hypothetical protein
VPLEAAPLAVAAAAAAQMAVSVLLQAQPQVQLQVLSVRAPSVVSRVLPKRLASRALPKRKVVVEVVVWVSASVRGVVSLVVPPLA